MINMNIKYIKEEALENLKTKDLEDNLKLYNKSNSMLISKYSVDSLFLVFNRKSFPDFELVFTGDNRKDDYNNMVILYTNLKDLTDTQASDERVWAGLAHTFFWDYMQKRWPLPQNSKKWRKHVLNNYFFWNSTKAPFLNGISRLWWYARFTYDSNLKDPFELTKYLCDNDLNGKFFPLLACTFSNNKQIFRNIVKAVKEYEETFNIKISRDDFNLLKKYINKLSGKFILDSLSFEELKDKIYNFLNNQLKIKATSYVKNLTEV
jgi:hypothetical protein